MPTVQRALRDNILRKAVGATCPVNAKAVLFGWALDIGGAMVSAFLIVLTAVTALATQGMSADSIVQELTSSFALVLFHAAACILMRVAGGYAAATVAGSDQLRHAAWTGVLSALTLGIGSLLFESGAPLWLRTVSPLSAIPCAVLGGYLASPARTVAVAAEETTAF